MGGEIGVAISDVIRSFASVRAKPKQFQVDNETFNVKEGSMVRVAPQGVRTWRNNSNEDLYYFVIQARADSMQTGTISDGSLVKKQIEWPEAVST